jgi:hypothetical protein
MMHEWEVASEYMSPEGVAGMTTRAKGGACHTIGLHTSTRTVSRQPGHSVFHVGCAIRNCIPRTRRGCRKTPRGLAPSFTRPQRRSQSDRLHNGYGTPSPIHLLREGTVGRTTVPHRRPAFTFTVLRTHIATSYCSPIPHLKTATAASSIISRLEQEAAASFQNLSTLAPLPGVALEFARLNRSSAIFVSQEPPLTASSTVFTDCPHCSFGQSSEAHSTSPLVSPPTFTTNTRLVRNSQPWNLCIPVLGDSPLRSR